MVDGPQFTDNQQRQRHLEMSAASAEPVGIRGWPDNTNCTSEPLLQSHSVLSDSAGWHFFWSLLFFFVTSTLLTKMGSKRKKKIEDGYKEGGQRNWVQVFSNAFSGTLACFAIAYLDAFGAPTGYDADTLKFALTAGFLGHFGCCIGDTWASGVQPCPIPLLVSLLDSYVEVPGPHLACGGSWSSVVRYTGYRISRTDVYRIVSTMLCAVLTDRTGRK
eukprot:832722-Rhodomonas_salina.3